MIMISLIGEQPIPNLLPIRHQSATVVVLVHSDFTERAAQRLERLLSPSCQPEYCQVNAFNLEVILQELAGFIEERGWRASDLTFNLTGGTKPMALAAYCLAQQIGSPFMYLQSEGGKSLLYHYEFSEQKPRLVKSEEIHSAINLDDYLRVHLGDYKEGPVKTSFEELVYLALKPDLDEVKTSVEHGGALEIDLVLRLGNQVGIAEVKGGRQAKSKEGIDQLTTAAEQRYLGTYTRKFLIIDRPLGSNNRKLAEAHRITVIELHSAAAGKLSEEDRSKLCNAILKALGG